ncbi:hypothetical protein [Tomitella biformata]|uniref:hypothetical protein n=1 Tax=Tomitella biformata TaxID=630403 RepID=UPI0004BCB87A|nr:hypothetical protein [Tomitella biformata]
MPTAPAESSLAKKGMTRLLLATVFAAASGYIVMLLAGRHLGAAGYATFTVFWGLFFMFVGISNGLMQETTRAVGDRAHTHVRDGASPAHAALWVGAAMAALIVATSPLWATVVLPGNPALGVAVLAVSTWSVVAQCTLWGLLAGAGRWGLYSVAMALDATFRLVVAVVAVLSGYEVLGFVFATVAGAMSWLPLAALSSTARGALRLRADVPTREFLRRAGLAMSATAATSVLVVGFPVLLALTSGGDLTDEAGSLLFAVSITRAPLLVPLTSFQSAIVIYFLERRAHLLRALLLPVAAVGAVGGAGAALAWWIGPPLIRLVGDGFDISGGAAAALTFGAVATAMLMLTGCAALANEAHRAYSLGWLIATVIAVVMLLLPIGLTERTAAALIVGPLVGVGVHLAVVLIVARDGRRETAVTAS